MVASEEVRPLVLERLVLPQARFWIHLFHDMPSLVAIHISGYDLGKEVST